MTEKQELIKSLSPKERDVYAEMIMRSLRGNWRNPRPRAKILVELDNHEMDVYEGVVGTKAETYLERGEERGDWDGRAFRSTYGEVDVSDYDEQTVRVLSTHIPHDLTWDDWRISKEFGDTDTGKKRET